MQKVFRDLFSRSDAGSNPERRKRAAKRRQNATEQKYKQPPLLRYIEGYFRPSCLQRHKKVTTAHRGVGEEGRLREEKGEADQSLQGMPEIRSGLGFRAEIEYRTTDYRASAIIHTPLSKSQPHSRSFSSRLFSALRHGAYKRRLCLPFLSLSLSRRDCGVRCRKMGQFARTCSRRSRAPPTPRCTAQCTLGSE